MDLLDSTYRMALGIRRTNPPHTQRFPSALSPRPLPATPRHTLGMHNLQAAWGAGSHATEAGGAVGSSSPSGPPLTSMDPGQLISEYLQLEEAEEGETEGEVEAGVRGGGLTIPRARAGSSGYNNRAFRSLAVSFFSRMDTGSSRSSDWASVRAEGGGEEWPVMMKDVVDAAEKDEEELRRVLALVRGGLGGGGMCMCVGEWVGG